MNFLYPQLLFGLFALAIPIIIHLFNFRRTKKIYFSNTKFLKKVKEASSSKLKLKHYLILFSRLLAIFFLVVAFAQPIMRAPGNKTIQDKVVIYLDNSASMTNEMVNGIPAFDASISYVNKVLEVYPKGTSFKLLTNDFESFSTTYKSAAEVEEYLTGISISGISRQIKDLTNRIKGRNTTDSVDVYWLSDMQLSTAGNLPVAVDSLFTLNIVPLVFQNSNNVYIDSVYLENPFRLGNEQLTLNVNVVNKGVNDVNQLGIKVYLDQVQVATAIMDISALNSKVMSFNIGFDDGRENLGRISIEEYPVTFDNDLYFVINKTERIQLLEIKSPSTANYVSNVYGNSELFDLASFEDSNVDYSLIEKADLVIVNGLEQISGALIKALNERLRKNERVLLIPGEQVNITDYQRLFSEIRTSSIKSKLNLAAPDFDNPFFANVFEEQNSRFAMPTSTPILDLGADRTALLKYQNGKPFLRAKDNLFVMATALSKEVSTFQSHALFVPVMYGIATQSADSFNKLYYYVNDQYISVNADSLQPEDLFRLRSNENEIIPAQRVNGGKMLMEIPTESIDAGYYDLVLNDQNITSLAFNNSPLESDLKQVDLEEFSNIFTGNFEIINAEDEFSFEEIVKSKYHGEPLWKWAILLCLLFLLIEVLLIRFFP